MINGQTILTGIIGYPIGHTLSPAMHNACYEKYGLNYCYVPLRVDPGMLGAAVQAIKVLGIRGVNVTIPYKVDILDFVDEISREARYIGAVNTIVAENNKIFGYNTDAQGFINSLLEHDIIIERKNVMVLGAGGAARAVCYGLMKERAEKIYIAARTESKINELIDRFSPLGKICGCLMDSDELLEIMPTCDIVVNCTPLGMYPNSKDCPAINWELVKSGAVIYDVVYNPIKTKFLITAEQLGFKTVSGVGMLVHQGRLAFEKWTGLAPDIAFMYDVVRRNLTK